MENPEKAGGTQRERTYELWEPEPAPDRGHDWGIAMARGTPFDADWEQWSYPLGNGYLGANVFGRVDRERIQITEKTLHNEGVYNRGGLTSFAELYLDFQHGEVSNYRRSLHLNDAIAHVSYECEGVSYRRAHFASYPDNVFVVWLTADRPGALSFDVRPAIPYLNKEDKRSGTIRAKGNELILEGTVDFFRCHYEGRVKMLHEGGSLEVKVDRGVIGVRKADAVTLLLAAGTNYRLEPRVFTAAPEKKLDPDHSPHEAVSARLAAAEALGYAALKERHLNDYRKLFDRVSIRLAHAPATEPTHVLLERYQRGEAVTWLEELLFQYGRYLLIASSREKTLPANLQGAWNQYYQAPWSGGFWHNINVQMNYWGAMSANLAETFEAFIAFFQAYLPKAREHADEYVRRRSPRNAGCAGENGWIIGTGANAYHIPGPGGHSGPGTGGSRHPYQLIHGGLAACSEPHTPSARR